MKMPLSLLLPAVVLLAAACSPPPDPRESILASFSEAMQWVKTGNVREAAEFMSEDYRDRRGNDRRTIEQLISFHLRQHGSIHIVHKIVNLEIGDDGNARLAFTAAMAGMPISLGNTLEQFNADMLHIELDLVEESPGVWCVTAADWRQAGLEELL